MDTIVGPNLPRGLVVVLADDDPSIEQLWSAILYRHAPGCFIAKAKNGGEAVRLTRGLEPNIVLMDLVMPGMDGLAATKALKAYPRTARIPVVAITGSLYGSQSVLDAGCDGYLIKPLSEAELLTGIRRALRLH